MYAGWKGRTVHLLKKKSKPTVERKKRKVEPLACVLEDYMREQKAADAVMETGQQLAQNLSLTEQDSFRDITDQLKRPKT